MCFPKLSAGQLTTLVRDAHVVDGIVKGLKQPDWPTTGWAACNAWRSGCAPCVRPPAGCRANVATVASALQNSSITGGTVHQSFHAAWVLALAAGAYVVPAVGQEVPGAGRAWCRAPGSRLERVEILGKQPADNELRRRAQIAKQVYGREELDRHGDTNIADVLQRLPGVTMQGNQPRMRGLGSGYTLVLINGDPAPPGFALDQLDPAQVERIEVTKGPWPAKAHRPWRVPSTSS